ncbi:hypothetical protein GCM10025868_07340 [Angustibacter aerolatus]|uniref:Uncharacterized protein n=1 Tax=Angustibacter aerolatus TaxID=1162965 RepID=A0ABQ6JCG5_9ACTN|nr:hypothetical protein GCM10025868_07340 [Angustibacter aerolatus]
MARAGTGREATPASVRSVSATRSLTWLSTIDMGSSRAPQMEASRLARGLLLAALDLAEVAEGDAGSGGDLAQRAALLLPLFAQHVAQALGGAAP